MTHLHINAPAELLKLSDTELGRYWENVAIKEPISPELRLLIRTDLVENWYWARAWEHRSNMKLAWLTVDGQRILLEDSVIQATEADVKLLCNKPTAFYWLQTAQDLDAKGERNGIARPIFASIYRQWFESFPLEEVTLDYGHFFASCVRVTATGPSTIQEIVNAHLSLCTQASLLLSRDKSSEKRRLQHRFLFPLCRSIIVVADSLEWNLTPRESVRRLSLSKVARFQSVLLVRTGIETGLSAGVSLESLTPVSLPLLRTDLAGIDAVRVRLRHAVQFIIDLEKREALATSQPKLPVEERLCPYFHWPPTEKDHVRLDPNEWADAYIEDANKLGYDHASETRHSIRRVLARQAGRVPEILEPSLDCLSASYVPWWKKGPLLSTSDFVRLCVMQSALRQHR